jgi:hypothetical protein
MDNVEFRTTSESSLTHVYINSEWRGTFTSLRKAQFFVDSLSNRDIVSSETAHSGLVSQKTDEVKHKRRGRPKKADNDRTRRI